MTGLLKKILPPACTVLLIVFVSGGIQAGWLGSWEGALDNPQGADPITLRLNIREEAGEIRIHARDSCGSECEIGGGALECDEDGLCFFYRIPRGDGWWDWIYLSLDLKGDRISGTWEDGNGNRAAIRLKRAF
jgi:hypothetical protein